jgi:NAD-dependent dihydropyrimidine dehydrogenase PreA subunit
MMVSQASCQAQAYEAVESSANTLRFSPSLCINCGACLDVCPHGVFALGNGRVQIVRHEACMECGACELNCPAGAITVNSGVGCASAMIYAALMGRKEVSCGGDEPACCE